MLCYSSTQQQSDLWSSVQAEGQRQREQHIQGGSLGGSRAAPHPCRPPALHCALLYLPSALGGLQISRELLSNKHVRLMKA